MSDTAKKMREARALIEKKRYAQARTILETVNHPKATEWIAKIDRITGGPGDKSKKTAARAGGSRRRLVLGLLVIVVIAAGGAAALLLLSDDGGQSPAVITYEALPADAQAAFVEMADIIYGRDDITDYDVIQVVRGDIRGHAQWRYDEMRSQRERSLDGDELAEAIAGLERSRQRSIDIEQFYCVFTTPSLEDDQSFTRFQLHFINRAEWLVDDIDNDDSRLPMWDTACLGAEPIEDTAAG